MRALVLALMTLALTANVAAADEGGSGGLDVVPYDPGLQGESGVDVVPYDPGLPGDQAPPLAPAP